ncbi:hypothetical protein PLICBS_009882 [Purpureocillium lilacinum]|uniref:uncharacterized protein n=1 Tax=Purpureocillium lilacinum TaxID=33203 RepID=UPI00208CCFF6|nr:hypothetical protein PLICBS_009882 [Purpureocillium lilacinum]
MYPLVMGLATAFPFAVSLMYAITDIDAVLGTITGLPVLEIYYQGTGSKVAASILMAGRDRVLPERYFSLGKYGAAFNSVSVAWVVFLDVLYCFPTAMPVTPQNMNYVSVISVGLLLFVVLLWFTTKRKAFKGPRVNYERMLAMRAQAVQGRGDNVPHQALSSQGASVKGD